MRLSFLALVLFVACASAADIPLPVVSQSDTTFLDGRDYILLNVETNSIKFEATFDLSALAVTDTATGQWFVGDEGQATPAPLDNADKTKEWDVTTVVNGVVTYQIVVTEGSPAVTKEPLVSNDDLEVHVLDIKALKMEMYTVKLAGCEVHFDVKGMYANPPLESYCGFYQNGAWIDDFNATTEEGDMSYYSGRDNTEWVADGNTYPGYAAWNLTKSLSVKVTNKAQDIEAGCAFRYREYLEKELRQPIEVPVNAQKCAANPLQWAKDNKTDTVDLVTYNSGTNCWTDEDYTDGTLYCKEGDRSLSVSCINGEYKGGNTLENYDEAKTAEFVETCGTGGLLPTSVLVAALALLAFRS